MADHFVNSPALRRTILAILATGLLLAIAYFGLRPYPAVSAGTELYAAKDLSEQLDPWLLAPDFADRTILEVDWVEGSKPGPYTIHSLESILKTYSPANRKCEVVLDQEIPLARWNEPGTAEDRINRLVSAFAGVERGKDPRTAWRYVLFVPDAGRYFGHTIETPIDREGTTTKVSGIVVSRSAHRKYSWLWISLDHLESMTLTHEFGHLLGLVGNPRHERKDSGARHHCTALGCAMALPTFRVIARNFVPGVFNDIHSDFCSDCQSDIRRAQAYWRDRASEGSGYREARERQRGGRAAALSLQALVVSNRDFELISKVRELRKAWPDYPGWDDLEAHALAHLDRLKEAEALLVRSVARDSSRPEYWATRRSLAAIYMALGRYDEAIALFDRRELANAAEAEFEQSAFVLEQALASCGSYAQAVELIDELLARKQALSYHPESMRARRADLLRRSGGLDAANEVISDALADRSRRNDWLEQGARLRQAQGRQAEEVALWKELWGRAEAGVAAATDDQQRASWGWTAVMCLARLGQHEEGERRASALAASSALGTRARLTTEARAWAALGDWNRVADVIRTVPAIERTFVDPCQSEDLNPMRKMPEYSDVMATCPELRADVGRN